MKGFKATYNLTCRDFQFEVGKTYKIDGELKICKNGFHFCQNIQNTLYYYDSNNKDLVFLEIEALGKVISDGDKSCTDEIKIVRIVEKSELDCLKWDDRGNLIYCEKSNGSWYKNKFDENNNLIYFEDSYDYWYKQEFDQNNNVIYYEDSTGFEYKQEFDQNNNVTYCEYSDGYWEKREYDQNNNVIYYENSKGYWEKREYDQNNNVTYCENSNGFWYKLEYDQNNNQIYFEDSDGYIQDNRTKKRNYNG